MVHLTSRQNAQPCSVDIAKNLDVPIRTHFSITNVGTHWCRGAVYKPVRWIFCHTRGGYVCQRAYQSRPYTSGGGLFEWDNGLINRAPTPVAAGYSNGTTGLSIAPLHQWRWVIRMGQRAYQSRPYTSGGGLFEWDIFLYLLF